MVLGQNQQHVQSHRRLYLYRLRNLHHRAFYSQHRRPIHSNDADAIQLGRTSAHAVQNHQPALTSTYREKSRRSGYDKCHWWNL